MVKVTQKSSFLVFKTILKDWNNPFTVVKCGQSYVLLCGVATFCEVEITEDFSNFLNIATLTFITNGISCKN